MKKSTLIITIIIVVALVGIGVYYYLMMSPERERPLDPFGGILSEDNERRSTSTAQGTDNTSSTATTTNQGTEMDDMEIPRLRRLSDVPVAGYVLLDTQSATTTRGRPIRFLSIANGNMFEVYTESFEERRLTNTTVPKVHEALLDSRGWFGFIARVNENSGSVERFIAGVEDEEAGDDGLYELTITPLPEERRTTVVSPEGALFEGEVGADEVFNGYVNDGGQRVRVISMSYSEWRVEFPNEDSLVLTTKADSRVGGFSYTLDTSGGTPRKILSDRGGLTTLVSPDLQNIIFSESADNSFTLNLHSLESGEERELSPATLPEKCVWSRIQPDVFYCAVPRDIASAGYPEDWYQGEVSFTDDIWMYNIETGVTERLVNLRQSSGEQIDAVDLQLTSSEDFLIFKNKRDDRLWSLSMSQQ